MKIGLSLMLGAALAAVSFVGTASAQPTARQLELTHRYLAATHMEKTLEATMSAITPAILDSMPKSSGMSAEKQKKLMDIVGQVQLNTMRKLAAGMEQPMADVFSEAELEAMVIFYESPIGQSVLNKAPELAAKMAPMMKELMPQLQKELITKICDEFPCTAQQKAAIK